MKQAIIKSILILVIFVGGTLFFSNVVLAAQTVSCDIAGDTLCAGQGQGCIGPVATNPGDCSCNPGQNAICSGGGTWQCLFEQYSINNYPYDESLPSTCAGIPAGTPCMECQRPKTCSCVNIQCTINTFNASNYNPSQGSSISLPFSLSNPASQTWSITRISAPSGANSFSSPSGTGSSGSPSSGTLNVCGNYSYRLSCGNVTPPVTVGISVSCPAELNASVTATEKSSGNSITASKSGASGTESKSTTFDGEYELCRDSLNFTAPFGLSFISDVGSISSRRCNNYTTSHIGYLETENSSNQSVRAEIEVTVVSCEAPTITSIQGYDTNTGQYSSTVYSNNSGETNRRIILYGSFASSGNTVTVGGSSATITYQSTTQINAIMPTNTGSLSINVSNGCGDDSITRSVQAPPSPPSAPTGLDAVASSSCGGKINVTWNSVSGATSYKLYRNNSLIATVTGTSYNDSGLTPGASYSYKVKAVNSNGESGYSNTDSATASASCVSIPPIPTGLTANTSSTCGGRISISWNSVTEASSYRLYRDGSNNPIYSGSNTSYTDTGLSPGSNHTYKIQAVNSAGSSAQSAATSATAASSACVLPPSAPTIAAATGQCGGRIDISWGAVSNATSYKIYRDGGTTPIGTTDETSYTDVGLDLGTSYSYQVRASNSAGDSGLSNSASAEASGDCSANASFTAVPSTLNYSVQVGNVPPAQTITLSNTGSQLINVVSSETLNWFELTGANATGCLLNPEGQFGDSCTISASVTSQAVGNYTGTLTFSVTNMGGVPIQQIGIDYEVTSGDPGLTPPTGQTAIAICDRRIDVGWNAVDGATSYEVDVYREENLIDPVYQTTVTTNEFIFAPDAVTLNSVGGASGSVTFDTPVSNQLWTVPVGTTEVTVEAWGGGGGGAYVNTNGGNTDPAQGGGGGGYSRSVVAATNPQQLRYTVSGGGNEGQIFDVGDEGDNGDSGGDSVVLFNGGSTIVRARGGQGGGQAGTLVYGGQAGTGNGAVDGNGNSTGIWNDVGYSGGDVLAGTPINNKAGGAGGAGTTEDGEDRHYTDPANQNGTGGSLDGGNGAGALNGGDRGGGGGSQRGSGIGSGGDGGRGEVRITYSSPLPPVDDNTLYEFRIRAKNSTDESADSAATAPRVAIGTWECETSLPPTDYDLEVIQNGRGTIESVPVGIDCPSSSCVANFEEDTEVTLTATCNTDPDWIFTGWGGDCASVGTKTGDHTGECTLTISGPKTASAQCLPDIYFEEF